MPTRASLVFLALLALGGGRQATASPITYAFAGTLQEPLNGSDQFSGSFTIDGDPKAPSARFSPYGSVSEGGSDVLITLKVGGQDFIFADQSKYGPINLFSVSLSPSSILNPSRPPQDAIILHGGGGSGLTGTEYPYSGVQMTFYSPAKVDLSNLRDLSFPLSTATILVDYESGASSFASSYGHITSIALVPTPTPEPSTLAVFAVLGLAAMARRHRIGR